MDYPIQKGLAPSLFPSLKELPQPPEELFFRGSLECLKQNKCIVVVGSRKNSQYGKTVCHMLIEGLRGFPVVIVSGLALGIDTIAHETALATGLPTIAFPGSGLDNQVLYPAHNQGLAKRILRSGGALVSEYPPHTRAAQWTFPKRNRLMAGIADLVLVIEAEEKSGTLITARLGTEYNKIVAAVPGPITAATSKGTNWLLRLGAVPITEPDDIIRELGFETIHHYSPSSLSSLLNDQELRVIEALNEPKSRDELIEVLDIEPAEANILFSTLEIKGCVRESLGTLFRIE
jgi:DNA processing protein